MIIPYNASKEERDRITAEREKKLYQSFENMRKQIDDQIQTMNFSTVSERVKRQQLEEIRHELQKQLQGHYNALEAGLKDDMVEVGGAVLNESKAFYSALQMPIGMSITSFPVEIMNNVVNGSVYQEKWYLSKALWGDYTEKLDQINEVISNGIGLNLPSFEIAKQLEQYVDPSAMTPSKTIVTPCLQDPVTGKLYSKDYVERHPEKDWTGFKEKTSRFNYGKVDYNAQRLARTLINHAYQQNVVHQAQANPFATGVRWEASGGERMCEICEERDGKIFPADDVPLDHPNGMCTFSVATDLNMMEMSNVLADFVKGEPTAYDDKLYAWYNDRAEVPIERAPDMFAQHVIAEGRDISGEWQRRPDQYDFEIEDVMAAQGFDGLPRVVSKEEFEAAVKAANEGNGFIAQRTYSASDQETLDMYRDMLYNGKWYVDCSTGGSQYGQGMYCAADYNGQLTDGIKSEMQHYTELGEGRIRLQSRHQEVSDLRTADADRAYSDVVKNAKLTDVEKLIFKVEKENKGSSEEVDRVFDIMSGMSKDERRSTLSKLNSVYVSATEARRSIFDISIEDYAKQHNIDLYYKPVSYTETLTLDPSARVVTYGDLITKVIPSAQKRIGAEAFASEIDKLVDLTDNEKAYLFYRSSYGEDHSYGITTKEETLSWWRSLSSDEKDDVRFKIEFVDIRSARIAANDKERSFERLDYGAQAALLGYDAINAEGHGESGSYTVVLNRTKLIIKEPGE